MIVQVNAPDDVHDPRAVPLVLVAVDANADAVYSVMVSPPLEVGATHVTAALVVVKVAATLVGASGAFLGVTDAADDSAPYPPAFFAFTVTAYAVPIIRSDPCVSAVNDTDKSPVVQTLETLPELLVAVMVYSTIASTSEVGALQVTATEAALLLTDDTAVTFVGAPATTVNTPEALDDKDEPALFVAFTLNV